MTASKIVWVLLAVLIAMLAAVACDDDNTVEPPPLPPQLDLQIYNEGNGLPNNDVFDIFVDTQGRTWFATLQGIGLLDNGTMITINQADGVVHPNITAITEFDGIIYAGTWGAGVATYDGAVWDVITTADGLLSGSILSIAQDDSTLYFATVLGVSQYNPASGRFVRFVASERRQRWTDVKKGILDFPVTSSVVAHDTPRGPEMWFGAVYGYITVWRPLANDFITYTTENSALPGSFINALHYNSADGTFWVGMAINGVASVDVPNSTWTHYSRESGLPSDVVYSIASQQDGTVWVGTAEGVAKQNGAQFIEYRKASGLPEERVRKVYVDPQDRVWLGFIEGGAAMVK